MQSSNTSASFFKTTCYFEGGLIIVALLLGSIANINPFAYLYFSESAILFGILGTSPLFLLFLVTKQLKCSGLQDIKKLLSDTLCSQLYQHHWTDLFILSAIAGFSEEVLFRGLLQPWLERGYGVQFGLIASSLLFGLVHAVTFLYAVLATVISLYLGLSLDYMGNRNLLIPVVIHGCYDFLVFMSLMKSYRQQISN